MKKKSVFFYPLLFLFNHAIYCQVAPTDVIRQSNKYYLSFEKFSVTVVSRFKNLINIDTLSHSTECYIDKTKGNQVFKAGNNAYVKTGSDEYYISFNPDLFGQIKKQRKYAAYESEFKYFPFTETVLFFNTLKKNTDPQSKISDSDSIYLLQLSGKTIAFRKSDYSIKSITEFTYDRIHKGYQFSQTLFSTIRTLKLSEEENIRTALAIINDPLKERDSRKKESKPEFIEESLLEENLTRIVNGRVESIKNKTILLDFFYQGCYPCVKSYPYVNALFKAAGSDLLVIGVDQLLRDTSTIDRYIEKYNLQYPILIGQPAKFLTQYFKLSSFPTFIIIAPDGKIIKYGDGFTKSSFKKLKKKFLNL